MMGSKVNSVLSLLRAAKQERVNSKETFLAKKSHRCLKILEKSLMK